MHLHVSTTTCNKNMCINLLRNVNIRKLMYVHVTFPISILLCYVNNRSKHRKYNYYNTHVSYYA